MLTRVLAQEWAAFHTKNLPNLKPEEFKMIEEAPKYESIEPENWTTNFSLMYTQTLRPTIDEVFLGQKPAEQAIKDLAPKIRKIIDETKTIGA